MNLIAVRGSDTYSPVCNSCISWFSRRDRCDRSALRCQRLVAVLAVTAAVAMLSGGAGGCASGPYRAGSHSLYYTSPGLAELATPQIEWGRPRPVLDAVGWIIG